MKIQMQALAAMAAGTILAASAPAATIFSADFNDFTNGRFPDRQAGTGLSVYASGDVPGWTKSADIHTIHAVDRGNGDFAIMFYDGNIIYYSTRLAANTLGQSYTVSFEGANAVYSSAAQKSGTDTFLDIRINDATGIVSSYHYVPTSDVFTLASFTYVGIGTGDIYFLIKDGIDNDGRFGGAIDNVAIVETPSSVPEPGAWAMMLAGFGMIGTALRGRKRPVVRFG